jgi:peptidoglycan/LPS O-acetylase OafA/YrhL
LDLKPQFDLHQRVPALDGLRGVAILAVFLRHYAGGLEKTANTNAMHLLGMLFNFGWTGVDLFFVLSGFLITGILFDTQGHSDYYKNFYGRRVLRIFPPYYLFAAVYLALTPLIAAHWKLGQLTFLVFIGFPLALISPALGEVSPSVHITHLWSICAEEQFYMIWPWTIRKLRTATNIFRACAVIMVATLLLRVFICSTRWLDIGWTHDFLGCRMDTLAVGAAIAIAMRGPLQRTLLKWAPIVLFPAAACVAVMCLVRHTVDHSDPVIATIGFSLIALMYGSLLLVGLRPHGWVARLFSTRLLRMFGRYSYAMYLFDFPLTVFLSPKRGYFVSATHSFALGSAVFLAFCLVVNLLAAAASYHFVEAPVLRLRRYFKYA